MTSSPTPDMSSLSLNTQPSQQRLNDTYDYDGSASGNGRQHYQFVTSPPISAQSPYNPLNMSPSPLKIKPLRGALPTVCPARLTFLPSRPISLLFPSNGSITRWSSPKTVLFHPTTILIFRPLVAPPLWAILLPLPWLLPHLGRTPMTKLYPLLLSSRTYLSTSNAKPSLISSYVHLQ